MYEMGANEPTNTPALLWKVQGMGPTACICVQIITSPVASYFLWLLGNYEAIYDETYGVIYEKIQGLNGAFL